MPKKYYRKNYVRAVVPKKKYSWEHYTFQRGATIAAQQKLNLYALVVPSTNSLGMRKCKNFTLSIIVQTSFPVFWALVYCPDGTQPTALRVGGDNIENTPNTIGAVSLYEPNQNVIMSGVLPANSTSPQRVSNKLARNLNSGDQIYMVFGTDVLSAQINFSIACDVSFCVAY